jgi:hypothetical protein
MRARPASRLLVATALLGVVFTAAGCGAVDDAQRVVDRSSLVNDLANRLAKADTLTYTATYQLHDGRSGVLSQAQRPLRDSFGYPGGKLIMTPEWIADCQTDGAARCAMTPPPSPAAQIPETLLGKLADRGLIAPSEVVGLLGAAALDGDASINQHETTIAGEFATCVDVTGIDNAPADHFSACITAGGLLASFTGTVNGKDVDIRLSRYETTTTPDAFTLPTGAAVTGSPSPSAVAPTTQPT